MTESPKLRAFNPVDLNHHAIHILECLPPEFFHQFEKYFNEILTEDDKLAVDKVVCIVELFHHIRNTVYVYKHDHFAFDMSVYVVCKKILTFLLYTLILDERIILLHDGQFVGNMVELMESALF